MLMNYSFGQSNNFTQQALMNKKWKYNISSDSYRIYSTYTATEEEHSLIYENDSIKTTSLYYLSDNIDTTFNFQQVGKNKTGKYIMMYREETLESTGEVLIFFDQFEIVELNDSILSLKNVKNRLLIPYTKE